MRPDRFRFLPFLAGLTAACLIVGFLLLPGPRTGTAEVRNAITSATLQSQPWNLKTKAPFQTGLVYTLPAPTVPLVVTTAATTGVGCSNTVSREFFYAWVDADGVSALSPASNAWVPIPSTRRAYFSWPVPPAGAVGTLIYVATSADNYATKLLITSSGASGAATLVAGVRLAPVNSVGDSTLCVGAGNPWACCTGPGAGVTCGENCTTSGAMNYTAAPVANYTPHLKIDRLDTGKVYVSTFLADALGTIVEGGHQWDWTSDLSPLWSNDGGAHFVKMWGRYKTVTICPSGCDYADPSVAMNASGNASTAANPIMFVAAPMVGTVAGGVTQAQDSAVFVGAGIDATTFGNGSDGTALFFQTGGCSNCTVMGMTLTGNNSVAGSVSGRTILTRLRLNSVGTTGTDEDCALLSTSGTTEVWVDRVQCEYVTDGLTFGSGSNVSATRAHSLNNTFIHSQAPYSSNFNGWALYHLPCGFESIGDSYYLDSTPTQSHSFGNNAYLFAAGGGGVDCASPNSFSIRGSSVYINDKVANGNAATARAVTVDSTATALGLLKISGSTFEVGMPNDTGNGTTRGVEVLNSTTVVRLQADYLRTTGGQASTRKDLVGNVVGSIVVDPSVDWQTDNGNLTSSVNMTGAGASVTAAATTTLPTIGDFFVVTGNTNITSVTASWAGRQVTLEFTGTPTFTDGSNLKLNGNLVATADDTITIRCDGTNWFEVSRSVN